MMIAPHVLEELAWQAQRDKLAAAAARRQFRVASRGPRWLRPTSTVLTLLSHGFWQLRVRS